MIKMLPFPQQAHLFAKLSELAYQEPEQVKDSFKELGFESHYYNFEGSQAYLLVNDEDLVAVCRGTQPSEFKDIGADLDARMVKSSTGIGKVHHGFKTSVDHIWAGLQEKLKEYGKTKTIWCTGHSLGAAMATILAYKLQRTEDCPNPQALFTYGSPKVGNKEYIKQIESIGLLHFRFVNNADVVTTVPPWPYKHFGGMYYMNHWGNLRSVSTKQLIKDRWRGFIKGVKKGQINFFCNHSITRYADNLENWSKGIEREQD